MKLPAKILLRDLALIVLAVTLLALSHRVEASASPLRIPLALLAGAMLTVAGYLVHEWGHLLGALMSRSVVHLPETVATLFLFKFDTGRNDRRQFLWMSAGGFIASIAVVAVFAATLSTDFVADRVALGLTGLGVLATFVLEIPPAWRVLRGAALPQQGPAFVVGTPPAR